MTSRARLRLHLVAAYVGWTLSLLLIEGLVAWAFSAAEGRPLDVARIVRVGLPPAACLGLCVTLSRARGARLDVALSALGGRPGVMVLPCVVLAWLACALALDEAASPLARRERSAWRIEDTATGRRVESPEGPVELSLTDGGVLRSDIEGEAARFRGLELNPVASAADGRASVAWQWLTSGPPVAMAAWALLATPTPLSCPVTLGVGAAAWLGAATLTAL